MWRWMRRWADWVRNDLLPLSRARRGGCVVQVRYEAAGRTHHDLPVPWSADAVTVEVQLRLPPAARRKTDFTLRFPDGERIPAEAVRQDAFDRHRVVFRFPVPRSTAPGELLWKSRVVAPVAVPVLTAEAFLGGLAVAAPALLVRLGGQTVAARVFVPDRHRGLLASAVLRAPHRLAPVGDLGLVVVFRNERTGRSFEVPVPLTAEQRGATEAVVTAACPKLSRRPGAWSAVWRVGGRELAARRVEAIPARRFEDSVRVADARFAVADKAGAVRVVRQPPAPGAADRLGPCFLVASAEPGAVGLCRLGVFAVGPGDPRPALLVDQEVLVTDAPTVFAPGLLGTADLARVGGFELRLNGRVLGSASLSPVPPATLTAEGGFKPPPDFTWTAAAEDELQERLGRLGNQS
jgi:hypothetical protein